MYTVDEHDAVVPFAGAPAHSAGSPSPILAADDLGLALAYETAPGGEDIAVLRFVRPRAHCFGPPGDETWASHPLSARGLRPCGIFEIVGSSWVRLLGRMDRVHPRHDPERFSRLRHLVFTFHDRTFECVAEDVAIIARLPNDGRAGPEIVRRLASALGRP